MHFTFLDSETDRLLLTMGIGAPLRTSLPLLCLALTVLISVIGSCSSAPAATPESSSSDHLRNGDFIRLIRSEEDDANVQVAEDLPNEIDENDEEAQRKEGG